MRNQKHRGFNGSPIPDTGSLRGDLLTYARGAAASVEGPDGLNLLEGLIMAADYPPGTASRLARRGAAIQAMLDRAAGRGEPELHFTQVIDRILAPIYFRRIFSIGGVDDEFAADLVDQLLRATGERPR